MHAWKKCVLIEEMRSWGRWDLFIREGVGEKFQAFFFWFHFGDDSPRCVRDFASLSVSPVVRGRVCCSEALSLFILILLFTSSQASVHPVVVVQKCDSLSQRETG